MKQDMTKKEKVIYESKSLSAEGTYDVQANETEDRHGQARAIEKMQDLIINHQWQQMDFYLKMKI